MLLAMLLVSLIIHRHDRKDLFRLLLMTVYRWTSLSLALYILLYHGDFTARTWATILGAAAALDVVRYCALGIVAYTFDIDLRKTELVGRYNLIWYHMSNICAAVSILALHYPNEQWMLVLGGGLTLILLGWTIIRSKQILMTRMIDIINILIYISTAEILPIAVLIYAVKQWT